MYATVYKNGNALIHPDRRYDGDWRDFLVDLAYLDELDAVEYLDPCNYGNGYAVLPLVVCGPSGVFVYQIGPTDYEKARTGHCFRLYADRDYPIFDVPSYYDFRDVTIDGVHGTLFKLSAKSWKDLDAENLSRAEMCGCKRMGTQAQYAPEMRGIALFVPYGVCHWYE